MKGTKKQQLYANDIIERIEQMYNEKLAEKKDEAYIEEFRSIAAEKLCKIKAVDDAAEVIKNKERYISGINTSIGRAKKRHARG